METDKLIQEKAENLAKEMVKEQANKVSALVAELEELRKNTSLTVQEKEALEKRIIELESTYVTKEEQLKREANKKQKELDDNLKKLENEKNSWQSKFTDTLIKQEITQAAAEAKVFSIEQILDQFSHKAKIYPVLDSENKETGQYQVKINYKIEDKELLLTPVELFKRLKDLPEKYGNLFRSENSSGFGGKNFPSNTPLKFRPGMSMAEYKKLRKGQNEQ